jgi:hypothetical protein
MSKPASPVYLYTYYKAELAQFESCHAASRALLKELTEEFGLKTGLFRRDDEQHGIVTLMETIQVPSMDAAIQKEIIQSYQSKASMAFSTFRPAIQRHIEQFVCLSESG